MQQQNIPETKMLLTVPVPIAMNCMVYIINIPSLSIFKDMNI